MSRPIRLVLVTLALLGVTAAIAQQPVPPVGGPAPGGPPGGPPGNMPPARPASHNPADAPAGVYRLDKRHVSVIINVRHQGLSNYAMRLKEVDALLTYDPAKLGASKVEAQIGADSLDVGDPGDSREFAGNFLDATSHPKITFVSTRIKTAADNKWTMAGNLTLRGITKPITLDVIFDGTRAGMGPNAGKRLGFSASGIIKRSDFGIAPQMPEVMLANDLTLHIEAEFMQQQ
jgi:polyisoprenoid-binding protein YceI